MASWNDATIQEFHAKGGRGVGPFGDNLVLLSTTGARSGDRRTTPLMFHRDGARLIVIASKGGAPDNPDWYYNLKAHPQAAVEIATDSGIETLDVRAREAEGEERERIYADRVAIAPGFGEYQKQTSRRIPVMVLEPIGKG